MTFKVVVVAFSPLARILGEVRPFILGLRFCFVVVVVFHVEISSRTLIPLFYAMISPQWLSELRRLWPNAP